MEIWIGMGTLIISCLGWAGIYFRYQRNEAKHQGALEQELKDFKRETNSRLDRIEAALNRTGER